MSSSITQHTFSQKWWVGVSGEDERLYFIHTKHQPFWIVTVQVLDIQFLDNDGFHEIQNPCLPVINGQSQTNLMVNFGSPTGTNCSAVPSWSKICERQNSLNDLCTTKNMNFSKMAIIRLNHICHEPWTTCPQTELTKSGKSSMSYHPQGVDLQFTIISCQTFW